MSDKAAVKVEQHYTVPQAVAITGISAPQLKRAIHATKGNTLRAKKNGRNYVIPESALAEFMAGLDDA